MLSVSFSRVTSRIFFDWSAIVYLFPVENYQCKNWLYGKNLNCYKRFRFNYHKVVEHTRNYFLNKAAPTVNFKIPNCLLKNNWNHKSFPNIISDDFLWFNSTHNIYCNRAKCTYLEKQKSRTCHLFKILNDTDFAMLITDG